MTAPSLPQPQPVLWPLRAPESARFSVSRGDHSRVEITVAHAPLAGVTPWKIEPWIRHHIEEVGNLEHFLPTLFAERSPHES